MNLEQLNKEQKAAVLQNKGPLRIIAGAGSGKTSVLTKKIAYLIKELKYKTHEILALTFTNKAAEEMKERVEVLLESGHSDLQISTFHSLCAKFLRFEISSIGYPSNFVILDGIDQKSILKSIYKNLDINFNNIPYARAISKISYWKTNNILVDELKNDKNANEEEKLIIKCYEMYDAEMKLNKMIDFDDLMIFTYQILKDDKAIRMKWQKKFKYILIDEFQDTSYLQYEIIKQLNYTDNITVVGDPDQTIYTWRGADISIISNFDKDFENAVTITLHTNYRSHGSILEGANKLIKNNKNRIKKDLVTTNEFGSPISFYRGTSSESEANWILTKINELKKMKFQLKDIAILYRSNYYSRAIEEALIANTLSHKVIGGQRFYERAEIKDSLAFLRMIVSPDSVSLKRIINNPSKKIGVSTITKLEEFSKEKEMPLYETILEFYKELPVPDSIRISIVEFLKITLKHQKFLNNKKAPVNKILESYLVELKYLESIKTIEDISRYENVLEFLKSIEIWESNNKEKSIIEFLEEISLTTSQSEFDQEENVNHITLMTIHAAKGLEFKNVFVIGMNEGIFPSYKSIEEDELNHNDEKIEEERRLAYVAVTRAKKNLFISSIKVNGFDNDKNVKPISRFVEEIGIDISDYKSNKKNYEEFQNNLKNNKDFFVGEVIKHLKFGPGTVLDINNDIITIKFNDNKYGIKELFKNHKAIEKID